MQYLYSAETSQKRSSMASIKRVAQYSVVEDHVLSRKYFFSNSKVNVSTLRELDVINITRMQVIIRVPAHMFVP